MMHGRKNIKPNKHIKCSMTDVSNVPECDAVWLAEGFMILCSTSVPLSSRLNSRKTQRGLI